MKRLLDCYHNEDTLKQSHQSWVNFFFISYPTLLEFNILYIQEWKVDHTDVLGAKDPSFFSCNIHPVENIGDNKREPWK